MITLLNSLSGYPKNYTDKQIEMSISSCSLAIPLSLSYTHRKGSNTMSTQETIEATTPLTLADRLAFMKLPVKERRRILAEQAELMAEHYEDESLSREREAWQGGDIVEY
jgi:hypothetical protein